MPSDLTIRNTDFHIIAREHGHTDSDLPVWSTAGSGAISYTATSPASPERIDIDDVPGAFQVLNLLIGDECDQFIRISDQLGFHADAPVSLPRHIRHNTNVNWVVDESVDGPIWDRCKGFFEASAFSGDRALGLNARFRFYRYGLGDYFAAHTDGAWPGSRVRDGALVTDAYGDRVSEMTFLIFLNDGYDGGRTLFGTGPDRVIAVSTPRGAALVFPHGLHPQHCTHAGEEIRTGHKYIIRTDVLYG